MKFFLITFVCLFNLSLMAQNKTLDEMLEEHKGKEGISKIKASLLKDTNAKNKKGSTALYWASVYGYTEIVKLLKAAGATTGVSFTVQSNRRILNKFCRY